MKKKLGEPILLDCRRVVNGVGSEITAFGFFVASFAYNGRTSNSLIYVIDSCLNLFNTNVLEKLNIIKWTM